MAIRFIIGRAGTGKTEYCLARVRDGLNTPSRQDERYLLLVPEQASLQTEYSLLNHSDVGATHRAEVLSFQRLAYRLLQRVSLVTKRALTPLGRVMLLRRLLEKKRSSLKYYLPSAAQMGFLDELAAVVSELVIEKVTPGQLASLPFEELKGDPLREAKLSDIRILYEAYLESLDEDLLDPSQYLELARKTVSQCDWISRTKVWVDGFAGFTGQQRDMLAELAKYAQSVEITAMLDPAVARCPQPQQEDPSKLFSRILRMYGRLSDSFAQEGITIDEPVLLDSEKPPRFNDSPGLRDLERLIFSGKPASPAIANDVTVYQFADRRAEADWVASDIWRKVRNKNRNLRYRDIAVISRDLSPYSDLLHAAFSQRRIPCFIDQRRSMQHHPLVELMRGLCAITAEPYNLESMQLLIKTGLMPCSDAHADELENTLLQYGIDGRDDWELRGPWTNNADDESTTQGSSVSIRTKYLESVEQTRQAIVSGLKDWLNATVRRILTGKEWVASLASVLEHLKVADQLSGWAQHAEETGNVALAEQHRQIVRDVSTLLDDCCVSLGENPLSPDEFREILNTGLKELSLGLTPPTLDQVLVGSIERSRHPDIRLVYLIGFNDGVFPELVSENPILNDEDREWMASHGLHIGTSRKQRISEEPVLAYTALTRASEKIIITYAASGEDGKAIAPSPYLQQIQKKAPDLSISVVNETSRVRDESTLCTTRELAGRLAMEFRTRPCIVEDDRRTRKCWNDLYTLSLTHGDLRRNLRNVLPGLCKQNKACLGPGVINRLESELKASVSRLETFSSCPFKHFSRYMLRLEPRKQAELEATDFGTIHHEILEHLVTGMIGRKERFADLEEQELFCRLEESFKAVTGNGCSEEEIVSVRDRFQLDCAGNELKRVLRAQRYISTRGDFRPSRVELPFGMNDEAGVGPLVLKTREGRDVHVRGYIDRVDVLENEDGVFGLVVDYKRTREKRLLLSSVYHGLSLQLLSYLLVLEKMGQAIAGKPVIPVGAFYLCLLDTYDRVEHPSKASDKLCRSAFKLRGVFDHDHAELLDILQAGDGSDCIALKLKKDGQPGSLERSDRAESGHFRKLLDHTRYKLEDLSDAVLSGEIGISPYRIGNDSPCSWCDYRSFCRFDFFWSEARFLQSFSRQQVFELIDQ